MVDVPIFEQWVVVCMVYESKLDEPQINNAVNVVNDVVNYKGLEDGVNEGLDDVVIREKNIKLIITMALYRG